MLRLTTFCLVFVCCVSCGERKSQDKVVLHVLRYSAAQFSRRLRQADLKFGITSARLDESL
jgi:hypothetical protein